MFNSILERQTAVKNIISAFATGMNTWFDKASNLAISTSDSRKLDCIKTRLATIKKSLYEKKYSSIIDILSSDQIIDSAKDLKSLSDNDIKYYLNSDDRKLINRSVALEEYVNDRTKRLDFLKTEDGNYKVSSINDLKTMIDKLYTSVNGTSRKEVCAYLANEAAMINRNLSNMNFKNRESLQMLGREIVRKSVFKCRKLSV